VDVFPVYHHKLVRRDSRNYFLSGIHNNDLDFQTKVHKLKIRGKRKWSLKKNVIRRFTVFPSPLCCLRFSS